MDLKVLVDEIRKEQSISPFFDDSVIKTILNEGINDINRIAGAKIDYDSDLQSRALLKNYVMYRRFDRLAEFKEVYAGEYTEIQIKYYTPDIQ